MNNSQYPSNKFFSNMTYNQQQNIPFHTSNNLNNNFTSQIQQNFNNNLTYYNNNNPNNLQNQMRLGNDIGKNKNPNIMSINQNHLTNNFNNNSQIRNRRKITNSNLPIDKFIPMNIDMNMINFNNNMFPQQQQPFMNQHNFYNSNNYMGINNNMMSNNIPNQNMYR